MKAEKRKSYIRTVSKRACEDIAGIPWITGLIGAVVAPLIALATKFSEPHAVLEMILISAAGAFIAVVGEFLIRFVLAIPKIHEEQTILRAREKQELEKLQSQFDDRTKRKKIKDELASCRITIQNLTSQLLDIEFYQYKDEQRQNFERDYLDMANTTELFLQEKVGRSEAASFSDAHAIPKVTIPPNAQFDLPVFKDRWVAKQFMLNRLKYQSEQLKNIESKLDSRDFTLPT